MSNDIQITKVSSEKYPSIPIHYAQGELLPEQAGFNPEKLEILDNHFLNLIDNGFLQSASYLLARKGKIFAHTSMGTLHFRDMGFFLPDSLWRIASITKMFTTIGVYQLWEQGKYNLYDPVSAIIKEFDTDMHRSIHPTHLLQHTSGLPAAEGYFLEPYIKNWNENADSWIRSALEGPLLFEPGKQWAYSSVGFMVLGEIIARVSGKNFIDYVKENIIQPLQMEDTYYKVPDQKRDRVCVTQEWEQDLLSRELVNESKKDPPLSAYGIISTLYDLFRLGQCLLNNGELDTIRILGRKSIEDIRKNQLRNVFAYDWGRKIKNYKYGNGVVICKDDFHSSSTFGHEGYGASALYVDPENDFVSVFFAPSGKGWIPEAVDNPRAIIWSGLV